MTQLLKGRLKILRLPVLVRFIAIFPFPPSFLTMCSSERHLSYSIIVCMVIIVHNFVQPIDDAWAHVVGFNNKKSVNLRMRVLVSAGGAWSTSI